MEHNPKKSKALIITFIIVLIFLIVAYYLFSNRNRIFGTQGTSISKIFSPLLGTSKPKDLKTVNNNSANTDTSNTTDNSNKNNQIPLDTSGGTKNGNSNNNGSNTNNTSNSGTALVPPPFNPIPTPNTDCKDKSGNVIPCGNSIDTTNNFGGTECSDGIDNDKDGLVDEADPGCHTDFNTKNSLSYDRSMNKESRTKDTAAITVPAMCPDDPLVFTEEEKAQLAVLLKQYYLLAPLLKIDDDVTLLDYDNQTNSELIKQADQLIKDCKSQKADPSYTGPQSIKNNPYYQNPVDSKEYIPGYSLYELMFNIW